MQSKRKLKFATTHRPPHIHPDGSLIFLTGRTYGGISWLYPKHAKDYFYNKLLEILPIYAVTLDGYVICNNHYHLLLHAAKGNKIPQFVKHLHGATSHYIKTNMPKIMAGGDQILTRETTPWDIRQRERLGRELKFSNTEIGIAQFIARHKNTIAKNLGLRGLKSISERGLKSANTENVIAKFISRINNPYVLILLAMRESPIWYQYLDHIIRDDNDYFKRLNYIHQNPVKHNYVSKMTTYPWSSIHEWIKKRGKEFIIDCFRKYPIVDFNPAGE